MEDNPFVTETYKRKLQRAKRGLNQRDDFNDDEDEQSHSEGSDILESSSEEHADVEGSVREEMVKLEQMFKGMGLKYRMIDRIGEGDDCELLKHEIAMPLTFIMLFVQARFQQSIKPKTCTTIIIRTTGTPKNKTPLNGSHLQSRRERIATCRVPVLKGVKNLAMWLLRRYTLPAAP